jgi:hypothetical protein
MPRDGRRAIRDLGCRFGAPGSPGGPSAGGRTAGLSAGRRWSVVAFTPLASVDPSALRWLKVRDRPTAFSLRAGELDLARLEWERPGGSLATAKTAEATWTLKRAGFLQPTILVRDPVDPQAVARLTAHLAHHELTLGSGETFRLRRVSHLVPAWRLTTVRGEEVLHIEPVPQGRALGAGAVVVSAPKTAEVLLLVVLSWYFIVLSWFEDEAIEALAPFEGFDPPLARGGTG